MIASVWLGGCVVGPNYKGAPQEVSGPAFVRATADEAGTEPPARWWEELADPELDRLIEAGLSGNPGVEVAQARLRESRAALTVAHANELPSTGLSAAWLHAHNLTSALGGSQGSSGGGGDLDLYAIGFDATWEIDFFGANRRAAEAAAAAAQGSRASVADAIVSFSAEIAQAYVQLRDAQQRLELTNRTIDIEEHVLSLMQVRRIGGTATDLDVERLTNQLQTTRATLGSLRAAVAEQMDRLSILTGRTPGSLDAELATPVAVPLPPEQVVIGDPAGLLRRRPDIAVAERRLAQQSAAVGQSVAALFPKVTLLGEVGFTALSPGALFDSNSFSYIVAPILQWTPLDFGRSRGRIAQSRAGLDEAQADYRRTVLAALEDAESALARFGEQRDTVLRLAAADASAEHVYALTEIRLRGGTASTIDVLDADSRRLQAEIDYQKGLAQLSSDFIALQKSLGLGWAPVAAG
jgi:NodT family efflux transporter outer membrane factor (OMF) lipoprotein